MSTPATQSFEVIPVETLLDRARDLKQKGWRFVQISATRLPEQVELTYSFDLHNQLQNLRLLLPGADASLPSLSSVYWSAFLYENELHDLFNVRVDGMAVDFQGKFYTTAVKYPFGTVKTPAAPAKATPARPVAPSATPAPATPASAS